MRKKVSFGVAVAAALAMAQFSTAQSTPQSPDSQAAPGSSTQGRQGMSTQTATGTVVSSSSTELVISTPTGRQTFSVDSSTNIPRDLAPGTRVTVDYNRNDGGMTVTRVRASGSEAGVTGSTSRDTTSGTTGATSGTTGTQDRDRTGATGTTGMQDRDRTGATGTTGMQDRDRVGADRDRMEGADPTRDRDVLPGTASPMGAIGLLGLAALTGSAFLSLRRRLS